MKVILFFSLLFLSVYANKPRIWSRIPKFYVDNRVNYFINKRGITNCFEFQESENNLLLKCWKNNKLTDVSIMIQPGKRKKNRFHGLTISI